MDIHGGSHAGKSVHNTRIERDVYTSVASTYVQVFTDMEQQGILNPDNDCDLFCLQFVFIPRINAALRCFQSAIILCPQKETDRRYSSTPVVEECIDLDTYGVDSDALLSVNKNPL